MNGIALKAIYRSRNAASDEDHNDIVHVEQHDKAQVENR